MELNRDLLDKFVDGELSPEEMKRVADQLVQHPQWNAYVQQQEALRQVLRTGFLQLERAIPERLVKAALETPVSRQWWLRQSLRLNFTWRWLAGVSAALAVGLVLGLVVQPENDFAMNASGQLLARGDLSHILDTRLAADNPVKTATRVGISFRNRSGQDCRTFSSGANAGLACHRNGGWIVEALVRQESESARAQYRMAGSEMPDAIRQTVAADMVGEPFDAAAEARARSTGWRVQ